MSQEQEIQKKGIPFRTRTIAISGLVIACVVAITLIVTISILFSSLAVTNSNVQALQNTVNGVTTPANSAVLCTAANQVNVYTQLVTAGNYCINSTSAVVSGAVVQRGGVPAVILCNSIGTNQIPIYLYVASNGDVVTNSYGTNINPPSGFNLGNGGNPIGYCYTGQFTQVILNPIYLVSFSFNSGNSTATIMTYDNSPVFGGNTYARVSNTPIGYGL